MVDLPRETALKILYDINEKGAYSNITINKYLEKSQFREIDKNFITGLVYGTIKWQKSIDYVITQFSKIPMKKLSPWILSILRLGIYQILYTDKIPVSAACNESVKLAQKYGHKASSGYVNGILRNISRNKDNIVYPDKNKNLVEYLAIKYSFQEWMVKRWLDIYGEVFTENILKNSNENPDFCISVNTLKISTEAFQKKLKEKGIESYRSKYIDNSLIISNPSGITDSELFRDGYFHVQDQASMLVSRVLDPKPGELVIDVCSAPGGKTANIVQLMGNQGAVIARDIHPHKVKLVSDTANRLGLKIVKTELHDATITDPSYIRKVDRVLVDAPCTGLGIIRRKPDIKWSRTEKDAEELSELQLKILTASSKYVKENGVLVYSTCTIEPLENIEVVNKFLTLDNNFKLEGFENLLPESILNEIPTIKETAGKGYVQLYPNTNGLDGFFIAKMRRSR
ncbi:MAG TPA: 16S rRNA (cytosine(967)-C(5))-methyltransferase RsmB [Clostridiaceae bacterium]|nr:16S rRNA (cytosine(967)-C(5))-methyltransferase RsmB [Clostridiaceae bacterium]